MDDALHESEEITHVKQPQAKGPTASYWDIAVAEFTRHEERKTQEQNGAQDENQRSESLDRINERSGQLRKEALWRHIGHFDLHRRQFGPAMPAEFVLLSANRSRSDTKLTEVMIAGATKVTPH